MIDLNINSGEVTEAINKLKKLPKHLQARNRKRIIKNAAEPMVEAAKRLAPTGDKVHKRYSTAKATGSIRAPKGQGKVVAEYHPGNLSRSIDFIPARKLKTGVLIGPKLSKKDKTGVFKGDRVDGYYAHMVELGNSQISADPYMRPAFEQKKNLVIESIKKGVEDRVKKYLRSVSG